MAPPRLGLDDPIVGPALVFEPETGLYRDALTDCYLTVGQLDIAGQLLSEAARLGNPNVTRFQAEVRRSRLAQPGHEAALLAPVTGGARRVTRDTVPIERDVAGLLLTTSEHTPHPATVEATTLAARVQQLDRHLDTMEARITTRGTKRPDAALTATEQRAIAQLRSRHTVWRERLADLADAEQPSDAEVAGLRLQVEQAADDLATLEQILTLPLPPPHDKGPQVRAASVRVREEWLRAVAADNDQERDTVRRHIATVETWSKHVAAVTAYRARLQAHVAPLVGVTIGWADQTSTGNLGLCDYGLPEEVGMSPCTGRLIQEEDWRHADTLHPVEFLRSFPLMRAYIDLDPTAQVAWDHAFTELDLVTTVNPDSGPSDAPLELYGSYDFLTYQTRRRAAAIPTLQAMTRAAEAKATPSAPDADPTALSMPTAALHDMQELRALRSGAAALAARIPPPTAVEVQAYLAVTREHATRLATELDTLRARVLSAPTSENLLTIALLANPDAVKTPAARDAYLKTLAEAWPQEPTRLLHTWLDPWIRPRRTIESVEHSAFRSDEGRFETVDSSNEEAYRAAQSNEAFIDASDPGGLLVAVQHDLKLAAGHLSDTTATATLATLADHLNCLESALPAAARAHVMNGQHDTIETLAASGPMGWAVTWTAAQETLADSALSAESRAARYTKAAATAQRDTLRADIGTMDQAIADLDQMYTGVGLYLRNDGAEGYVRSLALLQQYVGAARTASHQASAAMAHGDFTAATEHLRRANAFVLQASQSPRHQTIFREYQDRLDRDLIARLLLGPLIIIGSCGLASLAAASVEGTTLALGLAEAAPVLASATEIVSATALIQLGNHAAFGDALPDGLSGWALEVGSFWGMSRFIRLVGQGVQSVRMARLYQQAVTGLVNEGQLAMRAGQLVLNQVAKARIVERMTQLGKQFGNRVAWGAADYAAELAAMLFIWTPIDHTARTLADGHPVDLGHVLDETTTSIPYQTQLLTCLKIGNAMARPWLAHARDGVLKLTLGTDLAGRLTQLEQRTTAAMRSLTELVQRDPDGTRPESLRQVTQTHRELMRLMRERQALLRHYPQLAGSPAGVTNFNQDVAAIEATEATLEHANVWWSALRDGRIVKRDGEYEYDPELRAALAGELTRLGAEDLGHGVYRVPRRGGSGDHTDDILLRPAPRRTTPTDEPAATSYSGLLGDLLHRARSAIVDLAPWLSHLEPYLPAVAAVIGGIGALSGAAHAIGGGNVLAAGPLVFGTIGRGRSRVDAFLEAHPELAPADALSQLRSTLWHATGEEQDHYQFTNRQVDTMIRQGQLEAAKVRLNEWAEALDWELSSATVPAPIATAPPPNAPPAPAALTPVDRFVATNLGIEPGRALAKMRQTLWDQSRAQGCGDDHVDANNDIIAAIRRGDLDTATTELNRWAHDLAPEANAPPAVAAAPKPVAPPPAPPSPAPVAQPAGITGRPTPPLAQHAAPTPPPSVPRATDTPTAHPEPTRRVESTPPPAAPRTAPVAAPKPAAPTTATLLLAHLEGRLEALETAGLENFSQDGNTLTLDFGAGADLDKAVATLAPRTFPADGRVILRMRNGSNTVDPAKTVVLTKGRTAVNGFGNGEARGIVAATAGELLVDLPGGGRIQVTGAGTGRRVVITNKTNGKATKDPSAPLRTAVEVAAALPPEQLRGAVVEIETPPLTPELANALGGLTRQALWAGAERIVVTTPSGKIMLNREKGYTPHYERPKLPPLPRNVLEPIVIEYLTFEASQAIGITGPTDPQVRSIGRLWRTAMRHAEAYERTFAEKEAKAAAQLAKTLDVDERAAAEATRARYAAQRAALDPYLGAEWHQQWIGTVERLRDYVDQFPDGPSIATQALSNMGNFSESPGGNGPLGVKNWHNRSTGDNAFEWVRLINEFHADKIHDALQNINSLLGKQPTPTGSGVVTVHGAPVGIIYKAISGDRAAQAEYKHLLNTIKECAATPGTYRITIPPEDRDGRNLVPEWVVQAIGADGQVTGQLTVETKNLDATRPFNKELARAFRQVTQHDFMEGRGADGDGLVILTFRDGSGNRPLSTARHRDQLIQQVITELGALTDTSSSPEEATRWTRTRHVKVVVQLPNGDYENTILIKRQGHWYATRDGSEHVVFDSGLSWRESTTALLGWNSVRPGITASGHTQAVQ
ncbi:MAG: hypothetical protein HY696_04880 [Deltaproteobacteria bacterium]|nr:hypothetical protein [Deltaproteobacteria bacterium]